MATVTVQNTQGKEVKKIDLADALFGVEPNLNCVRAVVQRQMNRRRQGNACTKGRSDIRGSNAKPWRQKGTGRARSGTRKSPIWRGGGTIFGPTPRKYGGSVNRQVTQMALCSCLSAYAKENELIVVDAVEFQEPKTKQVLALLESLKVDPTSRVLFLTDKTNLNLALSARNLPLVKVINCDNINTLDLTTHDVLIATSAAIKRLEEIYA